MLHYIMLHYTILYYIALHYITLYYITLHYTILQYITLYCRPSILHYSILNYITLRCVALHCIKRRNVIEISGSLIWSKILMELILTCGEFLCNLEDPVNQTTFLPPMLVPLESFQIF